MHKLIRLSDLKIPAARFIDIQMRHDSISEARLQALSSVRYAMLRMHLAR